MAFDDKDKEYLLDKVDKIHDDIVEIKVVLAKQEENIRHHIKRTDLAEERIETLQAELDPIKQRIANRQNLKDIALLIAKLSPLIAAIGAIIGKLKHLF